MSIASKRRHVIKKVEMEYALPKDEQKIAQVLASCGNNLLEVLDDQDDKYLVSMPSKFRKCIWAKRGQFVIISPIKEGDRVRAEVDHILDEENVLYIREHKLWPEKFEEEALAMTREAKRNPNGNATNGGIDEDMLPPSDSEEEYSDEEGSEEDDEDDSCYNPNRVCPK
uniref:Probable RNA-binding protein EIF1AD n=1 Tax=Rhabditophanes sp. KR3021 TaxID=114890 RepID=A0AC35TKJ2_9BILA